MKISELITELEEVKDSIGDINVVAEHSEFGYYYVESIRIIKEKVQMGKLIQLHAEEDEKELCVEVVF